MSDNPSESQLALRAAYNLIQAGQYDQVDALLYTAQIASNQTNDILVATAVAATRQICAACRQCHAEIEWHQQAREAAEQREHQLRQNAHSLLGWISGQAAAELGGAVAPIQRDAAEPRIGGLAERTTLRQRVLNLFEQGKRWVGAETAQLPLSTVEKVEPPILPAVPQAEQIGEERTAPPVEQAPPAVAPPLARTEETAPEACTPKPEVATRADEPTAIAAVPEVETPAAAPVEPEEPAEPGTPSLVVCCLGPFRVYQDDQPVEEWPSNKGQAIFKYLVTHRDRPIAKEVLMELFWADAAPDAARNNLNVAIYSLRRALRRGHPEFSHVLFQNDAYLLNPELRVWVDVEEFSQHFRTGQRLEQAKELEQAVCEYRAAEALYQGEFLEEDRYEDWLLPRRQSLQDDYLTLLDRLSRHYLEQEEYDACILMCGKLLAIDSCREDAHRRLMRCYSRQGHHHLALRQYHLCVEALQRELEVEPDETTQVLYAQIRQRRPV
jgi:DNA-binding SARP family transcriptional activator